MKQLKLYIAVISCICLTIPHTIFAQQADLSTEEVEEYKEQARQMVSFLQYMMNLLGSEDATTQQKETIINQSFSKAFVDADVQIEDDLDEDRAVVTNKNVQAYLKDIDFFFKNAKFEFSVDDVSYYVNDEGQIFFRLTTNRNLQGVTVANDTVNSSQLRFIEVNLNKSEKQLKIASIYTTKLSEREELANWWNEVPYEWQEILKEKIGVVIDTVNFRMLREIVNLNRLDVSGNQYLETLEPLNRLNNLTYLDVSGTAITDLVPLRNLTKLQTLICSGTEIYSLEPLKYSTDLKELIVNNTRISDLNVLTNFSKLEKLYINGTPVYELVSLKGLKELRCANTAITSLEPLNTMTNLEFLDCSSTNIKDLKPIGTLPKLERLNLEFTPVTNLQPLSGLSQLQILTCNNTPIQSLEPLLALPKLEKIYCDDTPITKQDATRFMIVNTNTLVIYESKQLQSWWEGLDRYWQNIFRKYVPADTLNKEILASIANLSDIDISNKPEITTLEPLSQLRNLKTLNCANTSVNSLKPLSELIDLQELDCSGTLIDTIGALSNSRNLRRLVMDKTNVNSLMALANVDGIQYLSCEHTELDEPRIMQFIREHPAALVIYKSDELSLWWNEALSPAWKDALRSQIAITGIPTKEQLHEIAFMDKLVISDESEIWDLTPVREFVRLRELEVTNTRVADLSPIGDMYSLEKLVIARNPIQSLEPINKLISLEHLDCQDTPIEDLKPIRNFIELEVLKCSGTQVSKLKHISSLINLRVVEAYNTDIKKLKFLRDLYQLEKLVIYNTRVSEKEVESFKSAHPETSVIYY